MYEEEEAVAAADDDDWICSSRLTVGFVEAWSVTSLDPSISLAAESDTSKRPASFPGTKEWTWQPMNIPDVCL